MPKKKADVGCDATKTLKELQDVCLHLKQTLPSLKVKNIKAFYEDYSTPPPPPPPPKQESDEEEEEEEIEIPEDSEVVESSEDEDLVRRKGKPPKKQKDGGCESQCQVTCKTLPKSKKIYDQKTRLEEVLVEGYRLTKNTQEYYTPDKYKVKEAPVTPLKQTESGRRRECVGPSGGMKKCWKSRNVEKRFGIKQFKKIFPMIVRISNPDDEGKVSPEDFFSCMMDSGLHSKFSIDLSIKLLDRLYQARDYRELSVQELMFACQYPRKYIGLVQNYNFLEAAIDEWSKEFERFDALPDPPQYFKEKALKPHLEQDEIEMKMTKVKKHRGPRFDQTLRRASGAARLHHNLETFKMGPEQPTHVNVMYQFVKFRKEMDNQDWLRNQQDSPYSASNMLREMNSLSRQRAVFENKTIQDRLRKLRNNNPAPDMKGCGCHHGDGRKKTACETRNLLKDRARDLDY